MSTLFSLFGHGVFLCALILLLVRAKSWGKYWPLAYFFAAVLIVLPVQNWLVIEFSRGYFGDLSLATLLMCGCYIVNVARGHGQSSLEVGHSFKGFVLMMSAILFPATLGATQFDPYALGFNNTSGFTGSVLVLAAIALTAWYFKQAVLATYIALVLIAFGLGVYDSSNIWNYLIDPIAMIMCIAAYVGMALNKVYKNVFKKKVVTANV